MDFALWDNKIKHFVLSYCKDNTDSPYNNMLLDRCALISIYRNLSFHEGNQSKY